MGENFDLQKLLFDTLHNIGIYDTKEYNRLVCEQRDGSDFLAMAVAENVGFERPYNGAWLEKGLWL